MSFYLYSTEWFLLFSGLTVTYHKITVDAIFIVNQMI